ncbi:glycosyltransferase family 2 protein [Paenibacillus mendelii]|uniref:Glycosyltransferase family 2 protein n=1 Tax=Paenibacillus mendelii TaxID=206163 RepID=A0ABV6J902_9BACL|nr:glycosyltransferase family A protein [Paenibacillus mendelii]MCQ6559708.1 glycosyltransferase family 2 protein [Paenibacillus mendelii]
MESQVTVLIPFYNAGRYLKEAVESVFMQTYTDWELILIDDCSTDLYWPGIKTYMDDKRVKLFRHISNKGQSKSLNTGLQHVRTPFVIQLDADDLFYPYTLETMVKEAQTVSEKVGAISGNAFIFYETKKGEIERSEIRNGRSYDEKYEFLLTNRTLMPRFYRTSALRKINGWPTDDPYKGRYREDMRILYRLIEHYDFHWIDELLYKHRRHRTNHTRQVKKYSELVDWSVRDALKRWGDHYSPVFITINEGWKRISHLEPKKVP